MKLGEYYMLNSNLKTWLLHPGSFVERLKNHGVKSPKIQVIQQQWQLPHADERQELALNFRTNVLIREVLIKSDDIVWMFARTVFPRATLSGKYRQLAHLKTKSLGSILFKDPTLQRSEFDIFSVEPGMDLHDQLNPFLPAEINSLWARRSLFFVRQKPLLLTEVFFPDIEKLGEPVV
jgi:chorismate--pyruvate lyase